MTMEGTGTTIAVMPDAATTYYVRGEGGCVTDNTCLSISITISGALTTNTNDGGAGSLREAITCAGDGDTLAFDPGVLNMGCLLYTSRAKNQSILIGIIDNWIDESFLWKSVDMVIICLLYTSRCV